MFPGYPVPTSDWLREYGAKEPTLSRVVAVLQILEGEDRSLYYEALEAEIDTSTLNQAFSYLLLYLFLNWSRVANPLLAVERLVGDFWMCDAVSVHCRELPERVAGIGAPFSEDIAPPRVRNTDISAQYRLMCGSCIETLIVNGVVDVSDRILKSII